MSVRKTPDARDLRYLKLISGRLEGLEEEEIAEQAGAGDPRTLYERIKEDGHPICPKCGTTYADETHCKVETRVEEDQERQARGSGSSTALPPAGNAVPLFRERLEALSRAAEDLKYRKETFQGGRYFQSAAHSAAVFFSGPSLDLERETLGLDPDTKQHMLFNSTTFSHGGGTPTPAAPLPELISMYLLADGDLQRVA
jgi:hypothetical protein